jgi:hypothetical protein
MLKYLGLINIAFFILGINFLKNISKGYSIKKYPICNLTRYQETSNLFKIFLSIFSISQAIFAFYVCNVFKTSLNNLTLPLFLMGSFTLCLSSLFSNNKHPKIHSSLAVISVIFIGIGIILLSFALPNIYLRIILISTIAILPLSYLKKNNFSGGMWEVPVFLTVFLWNIIFSYYLL